MPCTRGNRIIVAVVAVRERRVLLIQLTCFGFLINLGGWELDWDLLGACWATINMSYVADMF